MLLKREHFGLNSLDDGFGGQTVPWKALIKAAILGSPHLMVTTRKICLAIKTRFPYYEYLGKNNVSSACLAYGCHSLR
jgi:hypothetical protein